MAKLVAPSEIAPSLGVTVPAIYGLINRKKITGHKLPEHRSIMVDPDEVRAAFASSKGKSRQGAQRGPREGVATTVREGDIISMPSGPGRKKVRMVTRAARNEVTNEPTVYWNDNGGIYSPTLLEQQIKKGWARIENENDMLGMLLSQWVRDDKIDLAIELETWLDAHGIEVVVPEIEEPLVSESTALLPPPLEPEDDL